MLMIQFGLPSPTVAQDRQGTAAASTNEKAENTVTKGTWMEEIENQPLFPEFVAKMKADFQDTLQQFVWIAICSNNCQYMLGLCGHGLGHRHIGGFALGLPRNAPRIRIIESIEFEKLKS